ncbi:TonB-dependent receptor [Owenweeksia hongkongensis DSM 17368]|uniref:TonB-dependent receptor n=1 Tax=Owenweeksia hongkongensis (strain DSM 17368 / CIP 108786 / JCM 12287 / NRRL B-23963 / UST20020801) TaxID=926562 RepID=G8R7W1_OWEHD|nr:TonB-dependent receptor [Owenweeksia hongkongensis]AEV33492.1 TonB-dependent receptor [Owenweeksia hongkongensis DSM 17368]
MKRLLCTVLLGCGAMFQMMGQGAILKGKISDAVNEEPLPGAEVYLKGTSTGSTSDLEGQYSFNLPEGEHTLVFKFIGYEDQERTVTLKAGQTLVEDVVLSSKYEQLNSVTITGNLQGQSKALNQQRSADNIKNVIASDQMGRFPDPNAAEALQRVSGVNIERDQGEGRYVFVRGLAPQFTNISVNGEQIPSPEADVRFVALDAIPADQLASMEVTKSLTPDMDGDAIGGSVNLITRTAETKKPQIRGSLVGGYNNLRQTPNFQGSLSYGQRFLENNKLGVLLNASYYENELGSDNWEREPFDNEMELRDYELTRTRTGFSSTIDYKFNPNTEVYVKGLYTRFTDREWRRRYVFAPEDDEVSMALKDRFESQTISTVNIGARHNFPRIQVDYEAQYSYGEQNTPYDNELTFVGDISSNLDFSGEYPSLDAPGYLDNSQYGFDEFENGNTLAEDRNLTGKFNIGIPYKTGKNEGLLKFGAKARFKDKSFTIVNNKYEDLGGVPGADSFEEDEASKNFLGDRYEFAAFPDMGNFITYFNDNPAQFELQTEDKAIDEAVEAFEATENVIAAYVMARQQFNKLTVLGGVRYERTEVEYKSNDVVIDAAGDLEAIIPQDGGTDYDYILPQLHFKYALDYYTNIRAAATFSYARPNFSQIVPAQEANLEDNEATVGNAQLKPVDAFNLDLLGEHYFKSVGVLSGGLFYKNLNNFIYNRTIFNASYPLTAVNPIATGVDITQAQNGQQANIYGVELAYQQQLAFLPGLWKNFNVYLNYTYTHSNAKIQARGSSNADDTEDLALPGQAANLGNAALAYENKKFSARVAVNFNGSYLSEIGSSEAEDIYIANRAQLDVSASYTITPKFRVFVEAMNLTNQPFEAYQGSEDVVIQREYYSWWTRVGVKFDL